MKQLYDRVHLLTFKPMRSLVLRLVVDNVVPASLAGAEAAIAALPKRPKDPPRPDIEAVPDGRLKALLLRLRDADADSLRNRVVHKDAYRPTLDEAKRAHDEARKILDGLTTRLRLGYDVTWYIGKAGR